jgi:hypothetical protein
MNVFPRGGRTFAKKHSAAPELITVSWRGGGGVAGGHVELLPPENQKNLGIPLLLVDWKSESVFALSHNRHCGNSGVLCGVSVAATRQDRIVGRCRGGRPRRLRVAAYDSSDGQRRAGIRRLWGSLYRSFPLLAVARGGTGTGSLGFDRCGALSRRSGSHLLRTQRMTSAQSSLTLDQGPGCRL